VGQDAEEVAQIALGVESVQAARGDERDEGAGGLGAVVVADERPVLPADDELTELALAAVVVEGQLRVVDEAREGLFVAREVAQGARERRASVEVGALELRVAPGEELAQERAGGGLRSAARRPGGSFASFRSSSNRRPRNPRATSASGRALRRVQ
jgi:hypothetical protein